MSDVAYWMLRHGDACERYIKRTGEHASYVTVSHGMRGYFATIMGWNPGGFDGFYEPIDVCENSHEAPEGAAADARTIAEALGLTVRAAV